VDSGEVGYEVDTRSSMCHGGWEVWVHGVSVIICISELIIVRPMYHIMCVVEIICTYIYIYTYPIHIQCAILPDFCHVRQSLDLLMEH